MSDRAGSRGGFGRAVCQIYIATINAVPNLVLVLVWYHGARITIRIYAGTPVWVVTMEQPHDRKALPSHPSPHHILARVFRRRRRPGSPRRNVRAARNRWRRESGVGNPRTARRRHPGSLRPGSRRPAAHTFRRKARRRHWSGGGGGGLVRHVDRLHGRGGVGVLVPREERAEGEVLHDGELGEDLGVEHLDHALPDGCV